MLGIVIPAHNEEAVIGACLHAAFHSAVDARLQGERVEILVVLDCCSDRTGLLAGQMGAATLTVHEKNVGAARSAGASALLARGARWLAFTDADTRVSAGWLADQLSLHADAVCGTVGVSDWTPHGESAGLLSRHFAATYFDVDGHRHVHGANLGVSASAYQAVGGFPSLATSEDVALVELLIAAGFNLAWSARPRVITSARRVARAPLGFAHALNVAVAFTTVEQAAV